MQLICRGSNGTTSKIGSGRADPDFHFVCGAVFNRICRPLLAKSARSHYVPEA